MGVPGFSSKPSMQAQAVHPSRRRRGPFSGVVTSTIVTLIVSALLVFTVELIVRGSFEQTLLFFQQPFRPGLDDRHFVRPADCLPRRCVWPAVPGAVHHRADCARSGFRRPSEGPLPRRSAVPDGFPVRAADCRIDAAARARTAVDRACFRADGSPRRRPAWSRFGATGAAAPHA